jgi:hypothetical protein
MEGLGVDAADTLLDLLNSRENEALKASEHELHVGQDDSVKAQRVAQMKWGGVHPMQVV